MTIREALRKTYSNYKLSPLDAEILLSLAIAKPKEYIFSHPETEITSQQKNKFSAYIRRRSMDEPIAYISRRKEFFGLDLLVNKNVLVPRPETELLVERALKKILDTRYHLPNTIVDVGTGSGNIIISIVKKLPEKIRKKINFYAFDVSKKSLDVAKKNAKKHQIEKEIKFAQSDMLEYFSKRKRKLENILIVANLPYVSSKIYHASKNNLKFEPRQALVSNNKGLSHYARLIRGIREFREEYCVSHVTCYMEISPEQKPEISLIAKRYFPKTNIVFLKDLAGKWRVAEISIPSFR